MVHSWTFQSVCFSSINQESDMLKCDFNFSPWQHTWPCQRASKTFLVYNICWGFMATLPGRLIVYDGSLCQILVSYYESSNLNFGQVMDISCHLALSWGCEPFQVEPAVYPCDKVMMQHPVEPQAQGWRTHFREEMWSALAASRSYWEPVPNLVKSFAIGRKLYYPIKVLHHEKDSWSTG